MRAMAPKPEDRFASLADLLAEMQGQERKVAVGLGGLLMIAAGVAAAGAGAYIFLKPAAAPTTPTESVTTLQPEKESPGTSQPKEPAITTASGESVADTMPPITAQAETPPPTEPPKASSGAGPVSDQPSSGATASFASSGATAPPAQVKSSTRVAAADTTSQVDSRRQECITQCERDSGECRSLSRRGKQDCMRAVAFGGSGRLSNTTSVSPSCAFYGQARCERAFNRDACLARMSTRYDDCQQLIGNIASRRQDCEDKSRDSEKMCLDELRDCRAGC
jgi:hypothetical protein